MDIKLILLRCIRSLKSIFTSLLILSLAQNVIAQPRLKVRGGTHFNLGTVYLGDQVSFSGTILNTGNQNLLIERLTSSCACTVPEVGTRILRPGDSTKLVVKYDSRHAPLGHVGKSFDIISNDVAHHTTTIMIGLDVIVDITVKPEMINFNEVRVDSFCVRSVRLTNRMKDTIKITGISDSTGRVQASFNTNILPPGTSCQVAALMSMAKPGYYAGEIEVRTNNKGRPVLRIKYVGRGVRK